MELLIDTNVILDYLLGDGDSENIKKLIEKVELGDVVGCITVSAVTDIQYILVKRLIKADREHIEDEYQHKSRRTIINEATNDLSEFISIFRILPMSEKDIKEAFSLKWNDFEDSIQYVVAKNNNMDAIITQNLKDFEDSEIPVMTSHTFISKQYG